ncbi:hypothetical protein PGH12_10620 [Chryseobacterium wangxinyae]|uniref:hypothetical protein n=1 Tax=Chryseobacterium sp. CY350 TaxID=2997336 RepID=UPI00226EDD1E|nr:hypothetical protein [Chryseobacterium sp. CY350]MCY0978689.1 hypothetical protein [Chryseobacterium sp. CY350]WBZ93930.1 hypothetical protein PGH12_10620 [Chryseobacterium sp. CY350]
MINSAQQKQIEDYLILNKLPLDILLEVRDHMISQVSDLQIRENLSFDEAFFKTKIAWEPEFKMTKYFMFYTGEVSVLEKNIVKAKFNSILKRSILIAIVLFIVNLFAIYISKTPEFYGILFKIQNGLVFAVPLALWIFHYNKRKFFRIDNKYRGKSFYTMYQQNNMILIACISSTAQIIMHNGTSAYNFFRTDLPVDHITVILTILIPFLAHIMLIFGSINLFEHNKALEKIQDYIKFSEAE